MQYRFILLHYLPQRGLLPNENLYQFYDSLDSEEPNPSSPVLRETVEYSDVSNNYFFSMVKSTFSTYFWIIGRWDQLEQWNSYFIDCMLVLASITVVLIMQNILIALMT